MTNVENGRGLNSKELIRTLLGILFTVGPTATTMAAEDYSGMTMAQLEAAYAQCVEEVDYDCVLDIEFVKEQQKEMALTERQDGLTEKRDGLTKRLNISKRLFLNEQLEVTK